MRAAVVSLIFLLVLCAGAPAFAADDPSEWFLNAYLAVQQGEKLESNGNNAAALSKFRYAASLLQQVSEKDSKWQPLIVDYRRQKTAQAISRVEEKIQSDGPGPADSAATPGPDEASVPPDLSGPLPEREGPSVTINPGTEATGDPLDRMTAAIRDRMERLEKELDQSRREVQSLRQEKQTLSTQLSEAQKAAGQFDVAEAQLRSELQQAQTALVNAQTDSAATDKLELQVEELTEALLSARADREAADELAKTGEAQQKALRDRLVATQTELEDAKKNQDAATVARLQKQLTDLTNAIAEARAEREAAEELAGITRERMVVERKASATQLATVTGERDVALATVEQMKLSQAQMEQLSADNQSLTTQLADAREAMKNFDENLPDRDEALAKLRAEIEQSKEQLAKAQEESKQYQTAMVGLQDQLDALRKNADAGGSKENELLRGIVLRQLKDQAKRDQAKKLVMSELARLEVKSDTLTQQLEYLGEPVVQLTNEEKALLRAPAIGLSDTTDNSSANMSIEIAAPKEEEMPSDLPTAGFDLAQPYSPFDASASDAPASENTASQASTAPQVETSAEPKVPAEVRATAMEARDAFAKGDFREAEKLFEKVLAVAPENLWALSNLGVARYRNGKLKLAEEALRKATAVAPEDSFSARTLGIVLYQVGRFDDAIDSLTKALATNPKDAIAHNYLGIAASQKGWPEAALKEMETAVALDPNYADAHFNLAVVHISARPPRKEAANQHYDRAVQLGAEPDPTLEEMLK